MGRLPARIRPAAELALRIARRYLAVGGGALAGGLAYALLFGLFALLLAAASVAALALTDPVLRGSALKGLVELLPPLAPYVTTALDAVAGGAVGLSLGTAITLLVGGARFYLTLEGCLALVYHESPRRSPLATALRALILPPAISLTLALVFLAGPFGAELIALLRLPTAPAALLGTALDFVPLALAFFTLYLLHRHVPPRRPRRADALAVALASALAIGALGAFSGALSPWLIGILALYGAPLAVILALVYLQLAATLILLGAAYLAEKTPPKTV